jgi:hypothetical protein
VKNYYDDIINLPHHVSKNRPKMSRYDRAAQFAPFKALVGLDDQVAQAARTTYDPVVDVARTPYDPVAEAARSTYDPVVDVARTPYDPVVDVARTPYDPVGESARMICDQVDYEQSAISDDDFLSEYNLYDRHDD